MHPVHASAQAGQLNCLRYLIDNCGVSVRTKSSDGATVAHFAAAGGHVDCLRWLLDMDEGLAMVRDNLGGMPMHDAAEEGQVSDGRTDSTTRFFMTPFLLFLLVR